MVPLSPRAKGRIIIFSGIIIISPDALCIRFLSNAGTGVFCLLFWKSFLSSLLIGAFSTWSAGGPKVLWSGLRDAGRYVVFAVLNQALGVMGFTTSLVFTNAANTLLLANLSLLWTALLGYVVLGERIARKTAVAMVMAFACVLVIFLPEMISAGVAHGSLTQRFGDLCGLVVGMSWACGITISRFVAQRTPQAKMSAVACMGTGLSSLVCAAVLGFRGILPEDGGFGRPVWEFWCVMLADAVLVSVIFVAILVAPRYIPGPEVALTLLLEPVLAPIWLALAYPEEVPPIWTLIGGSALILTLVAHEAMPLLVREPAGGAKSGAGEAEMTAGGDTGHNGGEASWHAVVPEVLPDNDAPSMLSEDAGKSCAARVGGAGSGGADGGGAPGRRRTSSWRKCVWY